MKLKEKLAEEWWIKNRDLNLEGEGTFSQSEAFVAGFEKARELALEHFDGDNSVLEIGEEEVLE
jgi:hypothetical protein